MFFKKYRRSVFIVTYRKTKGKIEYLLMKRKLHWKGWEFPKGGLRKFESAKKAIGREIKEETNLDIKKETIKNHKVKGRFLYENPLKDRPGIHGQKYVLYSVQTKGKVKINKNKDQEHDDFKWLTFEKAKNLLTWPNQKKSLEVVNGWLKQK